MPKTHYARSADLNIAYQVFGEGPRDLVYVPGWISNIDACFLNFLCVLKLSSLNNLFIGYQHKLKSIRNLYFGF